MLIKYSIRTLILSNLPLISVVLIEAHIRFFMLKVDSSSTYIFTVLQLLIESIPFFIAHYFAQTIKNKKAILIWVLGFICYPILSFILSAQFPSFNVWSLLSEQAFVLVIVASLICFINTFVVSRNQSGLSSIFSNVFTLNTAIILLLLGWALVIAGVFNSQQVMSSTHNGSAVIDLSNIINDFSRYIQYLWQLVLVAVLVGTVFFINRYWFIPEVLAKHGVLVFISVLLIATFIISPIFAKLLLWLPMNTVELNLFPSAYRNIFAPVNYRYIFSIFMITTPIILVFERQKQDKTIAQIAQQQTHTELKLLQQQINPHFLFNTLNNLYAMTLTKSDSAPDLVMKLSNLLRYTVYEGQKPEVILSQEIIYLKDYIALQKLRCNERCELDLKWPENSDHYSLPPLLIIILLENAFKHGVEPTAKQTYVKFYVSLSDNVLTVNCENPIFTSDKSHSNGLGLENLHRRLSLLYADKYSLLSETKDDFWRTKLTLELQPC